MIFSLSLVVQTSDYRYDLQIFRNISLNFETYEHQARGFCGVSYKMGGCHQVRPASRQVSNVRQVTNHLRVMHRMQV
jgi:hypothetical protein